MSKKPKYTPAPWHYGDHSLHGTRLIYAKDGYLVADAGRIPRRTTDEMLANAHLIAAAPELLAACEEAEYLFAHGVGAMNSDVQAREHNIESAKQILDQLRAAIVKAKGDTK